MKLARPWTMKAASRGGCAALLLALGMIGPARAQDAAPPEPPAAEALADDQNASQSVAAVPGQADPAGADAAPDAGFPPAEAAEPAAPSAGTTITVTSGTDPDNSNSKTCYTGPSPASPCTLRRAIVEARNVPPANRPVTIRFQIPATAGEGYASGLGIWRIQLLTTSDPSVLRRLNGKIIIDGATQPGGRASGPKIVLVGPGTGQKDGIVVGDVAGNDENQVRNLAFQNFSTHMFVNTHRNVIQGNWFGLTDNGQGVYLRGGGAQDGSGSGGIDMGSGTTGATSNTIQGNVFAGFDGTAITLRGNTNTFTGNRVGTAADGSTPGKQTDPSLICTTVDWLGGGGVDVQGVGQVVSNNVIAGLRQEIFVLSQQPDAIRVSGTDHVIRDNVIGVNVQGGQVGVCGRAIYLMNSPKRVSVTGNAVTNSRLSGISLNGSLYDANLLRRNTIRTGTAWPFVVGNPKPEDAIQLNTSLPASLLNFKPAKVTAINGKAVSGTAGDGSACPNCVIELFLDDTDAITEALSSLAVVTATAAGTWSATLPNALTAGQGIRTTSTSAQFNTIANLNAGTTTGLSRLYRIYRVFVPRVGR